MTEPDATSPPWPRAVIHLDLDAFYASVEQLRRPELRGKPVIVGGGGPDHRRGVVSAASYEVRVFGVRSAMPLVTALRLCPHAVVLPVDFPAYREASSNVFAIARAYTPQIEPASLDEAYLDVTASQRRFGPPPRIAAEIRDRILADCGLHASFGVATSKTVAKVASEVRKPRGFVVVAPGEEAAFLAPLPLRALPGLGPATETALQGLGVSTLGQLAALPEDTVRRRVGEAAGRSLRMRARGLDDASVSVPGRPKSVSREETFPEDVADRRVLEDRIRQLSADVGRRLRGGGWTAATVSVKLRDSRFVTSGRQRTLPAPVDADRLIAAAALELFAASWKGEPLRLLGVGTSSLADAGQLELLDPEVERESRLDRALDDLRRRFGDQAPHRGTSAPALRDLDWRGDDLRR
ncbi:MAG TPA: DNA polymerase IV [Candidatus Dormibacteraeota bacterium]|nr:DNA polymerase IV [Candidatus Dormibacteraeota bacterium]